MSERDAPVPAPKRGGLSTPQRNTLWIVAAIAVLAFVFIRNPPFQEEAAPSTGGGAGLIETAIIAYRAATEPQQAQAPRPEPQNASLPGAGRPQPQGSGFAAAEAPRSRMTSFAPAEPYAFAKPPAPVQAVAAPAAAGGAPGTAAASTGVAFASSQIPGRRAGRAIDLTFVMMPGIYSCTLQHAISSERPGPLFCLTDKPIRSPRNVLLMEQGTTITGRFDSEVGQGQERINALHAFAITPSGIPVPLGAQAGDTQGRSGLSGHVNTHWRARFGSAALLLLSQGAMNLAQEAVRSQLSAGGIGNTSINIQGSGLDRAISDALGAGRAIQNTVTLKQGEQITFLVVEPVDFSDALDVVPR